MSRIMGLDYGSKTVGVALSDPLGITVQPLETIKRTSETKLRRTLARIAAITEEYDVSLIVVGLPLRGNGEEGERALKVRDFYKLLKKRVDIPIEFENEYLTTFEADTVLEASEVKKKNRKEYIDQVAACLILKDYIGCRDILHVGKNTFSG